MKMCALFAHAPEIGKVIYTTNAVESVNFRLRKLIRAQATFPIFETAKTLLEPGLRNISQR